MEGGGGGGGSDGTDGSLADEPQRQQRQAKTNSIIRNRKSFNYTCQVDSCNMDLNHENVKPYYRRNRVCEEHTKYISATVRGLVSRYCQQCHKFHELDAFDGTKQSCRVKLQRRAAANKLFKSTSTAAQTASVAATAGGEHGGPASAGESEADDASGHTAAAEAGGEVTKATRRRVGKGPNSGGPEGGTYQAIDVTVTQEFAQQQEEQWVDKHQPCQQDQPRAEAGAEQQPFHGHGLDPVGQGQGQGQGMWGVDGGRTTEQDIIWSLMQKQEQQRQLLMMLQHSQELQGQQHSQGQHMQGGHSHSPLSQGAHSQGGLSQALEPGALLSAPMHGISSALPASGAAPRPDCSMNLVDIPPAARPGMLPGQPRMHGAPRRPRAGSLTSAQGSLGVQAQWTGASPAVSGAMSHQDGVADQRREPWQPLTSPTGGGVLQEWSTAKPLSLTTATKGSSAGNVGWESMGMEEQQLGMAPQLLGMAPQMVQPDVKHEPCVIHILSSPLTSGEGEVSMPKPNVQYQQQGQQQYQQQYQQQGQQQYQQYQQYQAGPSSMQYQQYADAVGSGSTRNVPDNQQQYEHNSGAGAGAQAPDNLQQYEHNSGAGSQATDNLLLHQIYDEGTGSRQEQERMEMRMMLAKISQQRSAQGRTQLPCSGEVEAEQMGLLLQQQQDRWKQLLNAQPGAERPDLAKRLPELLQRWQQRQQQQLEQQQLAQQQQQEAQQQQQARDLDCDTSSVKSLDPEDAFRKGYELGLAAAAGGGAGQRSTLYEAEAEKPFVSLGGGMRLGLPESSGTLSSTSLQRRQQQQQQQQQQQHASVAGSAQQSGVIQPAMSLTLSSGPLDVPSMASLEKFLSVHGNLLPSSGLSLTPHSSDSVTGSRQLGMQQGVLPPWLEQAGGAAGEASPAQPRQELSASGPASGLPTLAGGSLRLPDSAEDLDSFLDLLHLGAVW